MAQARPVAPVSLGVGVCRARVYLCAHLLRAYTLNLAQQTESALGRLRNATDSRARADSARSSAASRRQSLKSRKSRKSGKRRSAQTLLSAPISEGTQQTRAHSNKRSAARGHLLSLSRESLVYLLPLLLLLPSPSPSPLFIGAPWPAQQVVRLNWLQIFDALLSSARSLARSTSASERRR